MTVFAVLTADPIFVGLIVGLPSTVLGYLGYRQAIAGDKAALATVNVYERLQDCLDRLRDCQGSAQG